MEGPMVHIGAILGASVARWYSLIIGGDVKWSKSWSKFHVFTNVRHGDAITVIMGVGLDST